MPTWLLILLGALAVPAGAGVFYASAALALSGWDRWESVLRRLRPTRLPAERNAYLGAFVAEWPGQTRQIRLPGVWLVAMTERPTGDEFEGRVRATRDRIRVKEATRA